MLLALNKAFLYLNCQPRIFRKVSPSVTECVCTKNYTPVYKHSWMQKHTRVHVKTPQIGLGTATAARESHSFRRTSRPVLHTQGGALGGLFCTPGCRAGRGVGSARNSRATGGGRRRKPPQQGWGEERRKAGAPELGERGAGARGRGWAEVAGGGGGRSRPRPPTEEPPGGGVGWGWTGRLEAGARGGGEGARSDGRGASAGGGEIGGGREVGGWRGKGEVRVRRGRPGREWLPRSLHPELGDLCWRPGERVTAPDPEPGAGLCRPSDSFSSPCGRLNEWRKLGAGSEELQGLSN